MKTAYVAPVGNQTTRFGISETLTQALLDAARERLGLRLASESDADALIRVSIRRYSDEAVSFQGREDVGAEVFQRRVTISASVEIVDNATQEVIWSAPAVSGVGEYEPGNETEEAGMKVALENLVQKIVDGAQSQW
ncbi:MAG: LPS assembly lipoprotein LptE [Gemmatimonadota bacterium]